MKYLYFLIVIFAVFMFSCNSDNTIKPKWDGCISDKNCEDGQNCIAGKCVKSNNCENDEDCLNGQFCNDEKLCEEYCENDEDCGVGFVCNNETEKCEKDDNVSLCEKDSDCKANEVCENYKCVPNGDERECENDRDCFNGQHCGNNGVCVENCDENSCDDGYFCNEETRECEKMTCEEDKDCKEGFYCEEGVCKTKEYECEETTDCFNGYECIDNTCKPLEEECNTADDCDGPIYIDCFGAHWECIENRCVPKCGNSEKCGNSVCDEELGENYITCPQDCRDDHCDDGTQPMCDMMPPTCEDGTILAYYRNCYACVDPETCEPVNNECRVDGDCRDGYYCKEGVCVKDEEPFCGDGVCDDGEWQTCPQDCEPQNCETDADCDDGNLCTTNRCYEGSCIVRPVRCPQDMTCNPETGECEPDGTVCGDGVCDDGEWQTCPQDCEPQGCETDADCAEGEFCNGGRCLPAFCFGDMVPCPDGYECIDGVCEKITEDCQSDADCNDGFVCIDGVCSEVGRDCESDSDCDDGNLCTIDACNQDGQCVSTAVRCPQDMTCNPETGQCEPDTPICGNNICEEGETPDNCPNDCSVEPVCIPDEFEDNDSISQPAAVEFQRYDNLTVTYDDEDWYSFYYNGEDTVIAEFSFINVNGDIDVYAFQNGRQILTSDGYNDSETLIITPERFLEGEVLINAALIRNPNEPYHECQTYSMKLSNDADNICIPDQYEENNTRRNASAINTGDYNLTLCDNDIDWFVLRMNTYTSLKVATTLGFSTELYMRGQREPVAQSEVIDGKEILKYNNLDDTVRSITVYLKVFRDVITIDNDNSDYNYNMNVNIVDIDL